MNIPDFKVLLKIFGNKANGPAVLDANGKLPAFGADTQVQFNNLGTFAGSANFTYTETGSLAGGPELTVGTGSGTSIGWIWGSYASGQSGMWSTAVIPSTTNYALFSSGVISILNATTNLLFNINHSATAFMNNAQFRLNTPIIFGWTASGGAGGTLDIAVSRESAGLIQVNSGTAGQYRDLKLRNLISTGVTNQAVYTVATLPSASTSGNGACAFVSDANATTFASIVAGGGVNKVPVFSDGTNWLIG